MMASLLLITWHWLEIYYNVAYALFGLFRYLIDWQGPKHEIVLVFGGTFDSIGRTKLQDACKAGLVTIQGKNSAVLGAVLICK
ncbi:hypothetical protein Gotur_017559, partial [Gossypium turneri]